MVAAVAGQADRENYQRGQPQSLEDCQAQALGTRRADLAQAPATAKVFLPNPAVHLVATARRRLRVALATGPSLAGAVAVRVDQPLAQTQTHSDGQAGPRGRRYLQQVVEVERGERQPVKTGPQGQHQQDEPDRVVAVVRAMPQALAVQAVTVGSALVVAVVVVELLVVPVVEVVQAKLL
jgi:hypothetical protein